MRCRAQARTHLQPAADHPRPRHPRRVKCTRGVTRAQRSRHNSPAHTGLRPGGRGGPHPERVMAGRGGDRLSIGPAVDESGELTDEVVGVDLEPEQLRQLTDEDGERQPVHVADHRRLGEQVGDEAQPRDGGEDHDRGDHDRQHRGQCHRSLGVAVGGDQRKDRGRDHRAERGVRPQDQEPRGAEDRVPEQAQDRGVQAGDRRQAGQLGVRHALGNEQRGEHHSRDEVLAQPLEPVGRDDPDPGHQVGHGQQLPVAVAASLHLPMSRPDRPEASPGEDERGTQASVIVRRVGNRPCLPSSTTA